MDEQRPLPRVVAARALARCALQTLRLLAQRRTRLRRARVRMRLRFADGTSARVFRETIVDGPEPLDPCVLMVTFRLRALHGRWHALFMWECILNTPLFVGFPGLRSKLWLDHDQQERYRGFYEWADPSGAEFYARALWRVLELVCVPGTIHYKVIPGVRRDAILEDPQLGAPDAPDAPGAPDAPDVPGETAWWRLVGVA